MHGHRQLGGGNLEHRDPARRRDGGCYRDVRHHLAGSEFEELGRVQRGARPGRAHGCRGQGRVQLAKRSFPPGIEVRRRYLLANTKAVRERYRPVLDRDRRRRPFQQRSQRRHDGLGERELGFHPLQVGGYHLVTGRRVGRLQYLPDLVERHAQIPEPADDLRDPYLARFIEAVAGLRVDLGRGEQPHLVVVPQRYHAQVGHPGEITDGQSHPHGRDSRPGAPGRVRPGRPLACRHHRAVR